jgi:endonuclease YncB( thermonuclease family)
MRHAPEFHRQLRASRGRRSHRARGSGPGFRIALLAVIAVGGALGATLSGGLPVAAPVTVAATEADALAAGRRGGEPAVTRRFGFCHRGGGTNCVVDGDTFWLDGERIRVADIDAPETHPPRCPEEARLGKAATARLQALLNAGPVSLEIADRDTDRYGRKLRVVTRGGRSLGEQLVDEGLARRWVGRRQPWC